MGPPLHPWIALVQKGGCAFVTKVRNAQQLGALAVIVGRSAPFCPVFQVDSRI